MVIESDEYLPDIPPDEQFEPENTAEEIPEPEQQSPIAEKSQPDFRKHHKMYQQVLHLKHLNNQKY